MPPDILLLILDTARADAFEPWGGPHASPELARLCEGGTWFTQAISTAPWTLPSAASLLSGLPPSQHGINAWAYRWNGPRPTSPASAVRGYAGPWLPDDLRARGYETWAVSCNPWVSTWGGFDRGFDRFEDVRPWPPLPKSKVGWAIRRCRQVSGQRGHGGREAFRVFSRWLGRDRRGPRFALVNLMEMHAPYDPPFRMHPLVRRDRASAGAAGLLYRQLRQMDLRQRPDAAYVGAIRALYLAAGRYADRLVGRFVRAFVEGSSGPSAVIVVSDHGENLGDHGLFAHHSSLHESLLHVPLVVRGRGVDLAAGRVDEPRSLAGLPGWILEMAEGTEGPPSLPGPVLSEYESTRRHIATPREIRARAGRDGAEGLPALLDHAGLAVRDGSKKYVALDDGRQYLYDLGSDPAEARDLLAEDPTRAEPFRPTRDDWLRRLDRLEAVERPEGETADREIADHLKTLGYIE